MADLNHTPTQPVKCWPTFADGQTIIGIRLLDLIDWVSASNGMLGGSTGPENMPIIAMPPLQRTAVWRPKQVLDLWDSLMRGLPIGAFYLVEHDAGAHKLVRLGANKNDNSPVKTQESTHAGFELLDGQQRVRALLAGAYGSDEGKLCLWVDLGADNAGQIPCLRATSKAQPFGYDGKSGGKLRVDQRRNARRNIEPDPDNHPLRCGDRRAYDLDLFEGEITQDGTRIEQPPRPYDATGATIKLHCLLKAWRKRPLDDADGGIAALRYALPEAWNNDEPKINSALRVLNQGFQKIEEAQVALLRVEPSKFHDPKQTILTLFERIGAGGTPLSAEERLFSIYKHHIPEIRDAVDAIYDKAGRVLPPTKIAAAALRIANASTERPQYTVPNVADFAEQMASNPASELRQKLDKLIPNASDPTDDAEELLSNAFKKIKDLLLNSSKGDALWIPEVVLAALPAELWQVLVFWATRVPKQADQDAIFEASHDEVVRFALFWHVFSWDNEKAARWAFAHIAGMGDVAHFPGAALYRRFVGVQGGERCAPALIEPSEFSERLSKELTHAWRTDKEWFGEEKQRNEIGVHWWWSGRKVLPWLQRAYIARVFPGYVPLTDHEDDVPYDVDHMCPYKDWGDWWSVRDRFHDGVRPDVRQRMRDGRGAVGNGIGNLRLVESSTNKKDQDADVMEKMSFIQRDGSTACDIQAMADWAFSPEQRAFWERVSRSGEVASRMWDNDRLGAFQQAVEQRAAWLYQQFHNDLGFGAWTSTQHHGDAFGEEATRD